MAQDGTQVDVMVNEALRRAWSWTPTPDEAKRIRSARVALQGITSLSPIDAFFKSIRGLLPFAAGMIDVLPTSHPSEPANLVYDMPEGFLVARAQLIHNDPAIPLATTLPAGLALRGTDAMPHGAFHRNPYNQSIYTSPSGLNNVTGMILSPKEHAAREVVVLWLFSGSGARLPTSEECRMLEHVCGNLWEAMERIKVPLIPHQPLLFQILQEQALGYVVLRPDGTLLEVNRRAVLLAQKYRTHGAAAWRSCIDELITAARAGAQRDRPARQLVRCPDSPGVLELNLHRLAKDHYAISADAFLIEMREFPLNRSEGAGQEELLRVLPPRQREIAALLVESGLSYKEIAGKLALSVGTVRTHAERVYRTLRVHSRPELVELVGRRHTP